MTPVVVAAFLAAAVSTAAAFSYSLNGDISKPFGVAPNVWESFTVWNPQSLAPAPPPDFALRYPFLKHAEFFTATGGCYKGYPGCGSTLDLFNDPKIGMPSGVNVSSLISPLRSTLAAGLKPHIVAANVPIALSSQPFIGAFGVNSEPPANFTEYRRYIAMVAAGFVAEFGAVEVSSWRWGVYTEFNNQDWLKATSAVYADLFDYTVCGLEDALGAGVPIVTAHACVQCNGKEDWDPLSFLDHIATGVSACSGRKPYLTFAGNSFYETEPGQLGDLSQFTAQGLVMLAGMKQRGLPTAVYGVDEGRLLQGTDGGALTTRAVGTEYQASWDALLWTKLAFSGSPGAYYSRWGVNTMGASLFASPSSYVNNVAVNVALLTHRMAGNIAATFTGKGTIPSGSIVDGAVAIGTDPAALQVMVLHHNKAAVATTTPAVDVQVNVCGLPGSVPVGPVGNASIWRVDASHANFWPLWWADATAAGLSQANGDYNSGWSPESDSPPLASTKAWSVFNAGLPRYQAAALLVPSPLTGATVSSSRCVSLPVTVPAHGVAFVELYL